MWAPCFKCTDSIKVFDVTDSVQMYDTIADEHNYIKPKGTITAEFDKKYNVYVLNFSLNKFHKETIRLWPSDACSPSPTISSSEFDSVFDNSFSVEI